MKEIFIKNSKRYGYVRIHTLLKCERITISKKIVPGIMRKKFGGKNKKTPYGIYTSE